MKRDSIDPYNTILERILLNSVHVLKDMCICDHKKQVKNRFEVRIKTETKCTTDIYNIFYALTVKFLNATDFYNKKNNRKPHKQKQTRKIHL